MIKQVKSEHRVLLLATSIIRTKKFHSRSQAPRVEAAADPSRQVGYEAKRDP